MSQPCRASGPSCTQTPQCLPPARALRRSLAPGSLPHCTGPHTAACPRAAGTHTLTHQQKSRQSRPLGGRESLTSPSAKPWEGQKPPSSRSCLPSGDRKQDKLTAADVGGGAA